MPPVCCTQLGPLYKGEHTFSRVVEFRRGTRLESRPRATASAWRFDCCSTVVEKGQSLFQSTGKKRRSNREAKLSVVACLRRLRRGQGSVTFVFFAAVSTDAAEIVPEVSELCVTLSCRTLTKKLSVGPKNSN